RSGTYADKSLVVLRQIILDRELAPGQLLNTVHLSQALRISRLPMREIILRLAAKRLRQSVSQRGVYVRSLSSRVLCDFSQMLIALETHAVRLAARDAPQDRIDELGDMLDETEHTRDDDTAGAYPADPDFHARLARLAANPPLLQALTEVGRKIKLARARSAHQPQRARTALEEHREILAALSKRDGDKAAALLESHLTSSLNNALAVLRASEPE